MTGVCDITQPASQVLDHEADSCESVDGLWLPTASDQHSSSDSSVRSPDLKTDVNPVPPGGPTNSTPGLTDRVQRALASARATTASTVIDGQRITADPAFGDADDAYDPIEFAEGDAGL
jgi:hypothetical protein